MAAVTNHQKLNSLKQYKFIILVFWWSENQNGPQADIKLPVPFWRLQRRIHVLALSIFYRSPTFLSSSPLFPIFKASNIWLNSYTSFLWFSFLPPSSTFENSCDCIGLIQIMQNNLPTLNWADEQSSFQLQLSFYLLGNLTITGLREEDVDCFRGDYSF